MKKIIPLVLCAVFMLSACAEIQNDSDIVEFSYHYGGFPSAIYEYDIKTIDEKVYLKLRAYNTVNLKINREIEDSALNDLKKLIGEYSIYKWNGFDKPNSDILDGGGFGLKIKFKDGTNISANGHMEYPENYDEVHKALVAFLETLYEEEETP